MRKKTLVVTAAAVLCAGLAGCASAHDELSLEEKERFDQLESKLDRIERVLATLRQPKTIKFDLDLSGPMSFLDHEMLQRELSNIASAIRRSDLSGVCEALR